MRGPYGFESGEQCETCKLGTEGFFCKLSADAIKDFTAIKSKVIYPAGSLLFLEKQESRGVFVICAGEVKVSISSSIGKTLILRIAKAGEILGLTAVMNAQPYEVTAETLRPCQIAFIRHDEFMQFLENHREVYQNVVKQLSALYIGACDQLRTVGLSSSAPEKLARLLLNWSSDMSNSNPGTNIKVRLTHGEIAELIGSTRETVTRTLSDFKNRQLVTLEGSTLQISNRLALETIGCA